MIILLKLYGTQNKIPMTDWVNIRLMRINSDIFTCKI